MERIVFVLGAGASVDCHLLTGSQLRKRIIEQLTTDTSPLNESLQAAGAGLHSLAASFAQEFAVSPSPSIDAFLAEREDYMKIGKYIIAYFINQGEQQAQFYLQAP